MLRLLFALLALAPSQALPAPSSTGCKLFMYPVDSHGQVGKEAVISPGLVSSVANDGTDSRTGMNLRRVVLTPEGAAINAAYTKTHLGEKIAIFCGTQEIVRATIAGESSNEFVVSGP